MQWRRILWKGKERKGKERKEKLAVNPIGSRSEVKLAASKMNAGGEKDVKM